MPKSFQLKLTGGAWFGLFVLFYVLTAGIVALYVGIFVNLATGEVVKSINGTLLALICSALTIYMLFVFGWVIPLYRKGISLLEFDDKPFQFHGRIPAFVGLNVLGLFLSIITLFIYFPWYLKRLTKYLTENIEYDGARLEFSGSAGKFWLTFLWSFYVPFVILIVFTGAFPGGGASDAAHSFLRQALSQILFIPFGYQLYQWFFNNLKYKTKNSHWNTSFWPSLGMILGQTLLSFITIFVYWPAACLRIFRYFAGRTEVQENGQTKGRFEFQGKIGKGFLLIWGQALLCIITLFIYTPWAVAKVYRWVLSETQYVADVS